MLNNSLNGICPTTGKRQYQSDKEAQKGLDRFRERIPDYEGAPYLCLYCHNYHFGMRKEPIKKKRKRT
jgi:hypothetical protein